MAQNITTQTRDSQTINHGDTVVISGRKFTVEIFAHDNETIYLTGVRGGQFFLRPYINAPGRFQVVPTLTGMGAPLRNKASQTLEVFVVANTLTDLTGVRTVK